MDATQPIKVLYIGGYGRSGSTLLERMLGQVDGLWAIGEMRHAWNRSFRDNHRCSCGTPFYQCDFWSQVVRDAFGSQHAIDVNEVIKLKRSVDRIKYIPRIFRSIKTPRGAFALRLRSYGDLLTTLYRSIQKVSSAEVIVDASKDPSFAFVLASMASVDLSVVHLVRDSRAVAFSWTRKKRRGDILNQSAYLPVFRPSVSALRWIAYNWPFHLLKRLVPYRRVRYEDMLSEPRRFVGDFLRFVQVNPDTRDLSFLSDDAVELGPNHTVSGNPLRFRTGTLPLRCDDQWRGQMALTKQHVVGLLTIHLMWQYGYY